jgi:sugar phosphate isomerase/epimerase
MLAVTLPGTGIEYVELLKKIGYDYIELPLAQVMDLDDRKFQAIVAKFNSSGIRCEVCNIFFPAEIRLTGKEVAGEKIRAYLEVALKRAAQLGVEFIVFGSSGARNVPEGFPLEAAWEQLVSLLRDLDKMLKPYGITVLIEPLNRLESNIINHTSEGFQLAKEVDCVNIKLLVDYYHWALEKEDTGILLETGDYLKHVHFSRPEGRVFPKETDPDDYPPFFEHLKKIGYNRRVSVEAYTDDLENDAVQSLAFLKKIFA